MVAAFYICLRFWPLHTLWSLSTVRLDSVCCSVNCELIATYQTILQD